MHATFVKLTGAVTALNKELKALTQGATAVDKVAVAVQRLAGTGGAAGGGTLSPGKFSPTGGARNPAANVPSGAGGGGVGGPPAPAGEGGVWSHVRSQITPGKVVLGAAVAGGAYLAKHLPNIEAGNLMFNQLGRGQVGSAGIADIRKGTFGEHGKPGGLPFYTGTDDLMGGVSAMTPFAGSYGTARWNKDMKTASAVGQLLPGQGAAGSMTATAGMLAPGMDNQLTAAGYGGSKIAGGAHRSIQEVAKSIQQKLWGGPAPNEQVITEGMEPGAPLFLNLKFLPQDTQQYIVQYMLAEVRTKGHADQAIAGKSKADKDYAKQANVGTSIYDHHAKLTKSLAQTEQEAGEEASGTLKGSFDGLNASVNRLSGAFTKLAPVMATAMLVVGPLTAAMSSAIGSVVAYAAMNRISGVGGRGGGGFMGGLRGSPKRIGAPIGTMGKVGRFAGKAGMAGMAYGAMDVAGDAMQQAGGHKRDHKKWHWQDVGKGAWASAKGAAAGFLIAGPAGAVVGGLAGAGKSTYDYFHDQEGYSARTENSVLDDSQNPEQGGSGEGAGRGPQTYKQLEAWMAASGVPSRVSSDLRPGSRTHASGSLSYHATGQAVDFAGRKPGRDTTEMLKINQWWAKNHGKGLKELIYSGPGGINLYNGMPHIYNSVTAADHHDHVHVAGTAASLGIKGGMGGGGTGTVPATPGAAKPAATPAAAVAGASAGGGGGGSGGGASNELELLQSLVTGGGGGGMQATTIAATPPGAPAATPPAAGADNSAYSGPAAKGRPKFIPAGDWNIVSSLAKAAGVDPALMAAIGWWETHWGKLGDGRKGNLLGVGSFDSGSTYKYAGVKNQITMGLKILNADHVTGIGNIDLARTGPRRWATDPKWADGVRSSYKYVAKNSYEKGSWEIVQNELAQLHQGEMVLPQKTAKKVRELVRPDAPAPGRSGGTAQVTVHAPITVMTAMSEFEIDRWMKVIERKLEHSRVLTSIAGGV